MIATLTATATLAAITTLTPPAPPAVAKGVPCATVNICGDVRHVNAGASKRIKVRCHSGAIQYLYKGQAATCDDVNAVYVYKHWELWDRIYYRGHPNWEKWGDATGWKDVWDIDNLNLKSVHD